MIRLNDGAGFLLDDGLDYVLDDGTGTGTGQFGSPVILADNRFLDGIPAVTGVTDNSPLVVRDGRPYTWLQFPAAGTNYLSVDCGMLLPANALGICGHNLFTAGADVSVESSLDGNAWTRRLSPFIPSSDRALLKTFATVSDRHWRLKMVTADVAPLIAVCMLGSRIVFPFPPDAGTPVTVSVEEDSKDSKTGNALGTVVRYSPADIAPQFSQYNRSWVETVYRPFWMQYARLRKYFFWAQDLGTWPTEVYYVRDAGKYDPSISVLAYYDKLKLALKGVMEP